MRYRKGWIALGIMAVLTPIGLLAIGAAWGEWDIGTVEEMSGHEPEGMRRSMEAQPEAPLAEYEIPGLSGGPWRTGFGTILSAVIGAGITAGAAILIGRLVRHGAIS